MKSLVAAMIGIVAVASSSARAERIFYDDFQTFGAPWSIYVSNAPPPGNQFGPLKLETWPRDANHTPDCVNPPDCDPRGETGPQCLCTSARQEEHSQAWFSWQHDISVPEYSTVKYSAWFLDLLYRTDRTEVDFGHFQVQGGITLLDAVELDHFLLGIHAHWTNPEANWLYYSWKTFMDGWHVSSIPRTLGWHRFEIVVHPYTGAVGDVEFFIDGQKAGEGQRYASEGLVFPPGTIRIGADPSFMEEDYVANTYQRIFYDDVEVSLKDRTDFDFDGDADLTDFGHFQSCFNGPNRPPARSTGCQDTDFDGDSDVDLTDFGVFQACFNGPNRPVNAECNG